MPAHPTRRTKFRQPAAGAPSDDPEREPVARDHRVVRVLVTSTYFAPGVRAGGPVRSVGHIVASVPDRIRPTVITRDRDLGGRAAYDGLSGRWSTYGPARVFYLDQGSCRQLWRLWRELHTTRFDTLYVNSLWAPFSAVPLAARKLGLLHADRVLIAPRGECSPAALSLHRRRKRLLLPVWRLLVAGARVQWHATAPAEAAHIGQLFPRARVSVNTAQSPLPAEPMAPPPSGNRCRLVFLGRIVPMKNVALLIEALLQVTCELDVDLYGPIEDAAYWQRCTELARRLPAAVHLRHRGTLAPQQVRAVLSTYDGMVLPTLGENFGHVIAESLSVSCPVLCSDRTPWTPVLRAGGGRVVADLSPAAWAEALQTVAELSRTARASERTAAGVAYRRWRTTLSGRNVLDETLEPAKSTDRPWRRAPVPTRPAAAAGRGPDHHVQHARKGPSRV